MKTPAGALVAVLVAAALSGCGAIAPAMAVLSAAESGYMIADRFTEAGTKVIATACADYEAKKQVTYAKLSLGAAADAAAGPKAVSIASFGDRACAHPPAGDPITTAIWLGGLGEQLLGLTRRG